MSKRQGGVNYGIQANTVTGGAIAVGQGATATQNITGGADTEALRAAIEELRASLAKSELPSEARAMLEEDVKTVAAEAGKAAPDQDRVEAALKGLASKVKLATQFAQGAAELVEPVRKIGTAIGLGAAALGLL